MRAGFNYISQWLERENPGKTYQIVSAGGACSVLVFKNRKKTKDVDVYTPNADDLAAVLAAGRDYVRYSGAPPSWINIAYVANNRGGDTLFDNSVRQRVLLYESATLQVFAADWRFQLVGKIVRAGNFEDPKDIKDAVSILRILVEERGGMLKLSEMRDWYESGALIRPEHVELINKEYESKYDELGIAVEI
ncbi:hypothetical protein R3P38DRAFT_2890419 [Favolaschia claudopus]|uniref:Uncharacterized protein n=1 Tax=Favolaschia claudopus TaxID=2862362 RepID=A0AAW0CTP3_9AGAR